MNVGTGVTVRNTQRIGEILMNKKLVAIMTFVLIALGATMTISSHNIGTQNCEAPSVVNSLTLPYLVKKIRYLVLKSYHILKKINPPTTG